MVEQTNFAFANSLFVGTEKSRSTIKSENETSLMIPPVCSRVLLLIALSKSQMLTDIQSLVSFQYRTGIIEKANYYVHITQRQCTANVNKEPGFSCGRNSKTSGVDITSSSCCKTDLCNWQPGGKDKNDIDKGTLTGNAFRLASTGWTLILSNIAIVMMRFI